MVSFFRFLFSLALLGSTFSGFSQNLGLSPYSKTALGDLSTETGNRDTDMGHTGVANYSMDGFSIANPAYLHNYIYQNSPARHTYFNFSLSGKATKFNSSNGNDQSFGANIDRVAILLPINRYRRTPHKWGMAFVVKPFSSINYNFNGTSTIPNDSITYTYSNNGTGGLSELVWGNGVKLSKNFSLGLNTSYVFGKYNRQIETQLSNSSKRYSFTNDNRMTFFVLKPGFSYTGNIHKTDTVLKYKDVIDSLTGLKTKIGYNVIDTIPTDLFVHVGLTYESGFAGKNELNSSKKIIDETNINATIDTISNASVTKYNLPGEIKLGFSLTNLEYRIFPNWSMTSQLGYRQWALYNPSLNYRNTFSAGVGFEKKIVFGNALKPKLAFGRVGAYYNQLPYQFNNSYIDEKGITFGGTLNLAGVKGLSDRMLLNASVAVGQRGSVKNNLIAEKFIKFSLGFTFLEDRWFYKYRLN